MPYSGADVLAQLSDLIRQGANIPPLTSLLVIASAPAEGDVLKSALRAIVGYNATIFVEASVAVAVKTLLHTKPQITFLLDDSKQALASFSDHLAELRAAGFACPIVVVSDCVTAQVRLRLLEQGALDAFHRDDICGLRLRQCILRIAAPEFSAGSA